MGPPQNIPKNKNDFCHLLIELTHSAIIIYEIPQISQLFVIVGLTRKKFAHLKVCHNFFILMILTDELMNHRDEQGWKYFQKSCG